MTSLAELMYGKFDAVQHEGSCKWANCCNCSYYGTRNLLKHPVVMSRFGPGMEAPVDMVFVTDPPDEAATDLGLAGVGPQADFLLHLYECAMEDLDAAKRPRLDYAFIPVIGCATDIVTSSCEQKLIEDLEYLEPQLIIACSVKVADYLKGKSECTVVRVSDRPAYAKLDSKDAENRFIGDVMSIRTAIMQIWKVRISQRVRKPGTISSF